MIESDGVDLLLLLRPRSPHPLILFRKRSVESKRNTHNNHWSHRPCIDCRSNLSHDSTMAIRTHVSEGQCDMWLLTLAGASSLDSAAPNHQNALLFPSHSCTANLLLTIKVDPDHQKHARHQRLISKINAHFRREPRVFLTSATAILTVFHFLSFRIRTKPCYMERSRATPRASFPTAHANLTFSTCLTSLSNLYIVVCGSIGRAYLTSFGWCLEGWRGFQSGLGKLRCGESVE